MGSFRRILCAIALAVAAPVAQAAPFSIKYQGTLTSDFGRAFASTGWSVGTTFRAVGVYDSTSLPVSSDATAASYATTITT